MMPSSRDSWATSGSNRVDPVSHPGYELHLGRAHCRLGSRRGSDREKDATKKDAEKKKEEKPAPPPAKINVIASPTWT